MQTTALPKKVIWAGTVLILLTGLIHLMDTPGSFDDATYKGLLFAANTLGAMVAAVGIYRNDRPGWLLGLAVAGGSILGYLISRTAGLPGLEPEGWGEPMGVLSLIVEGTFVIIAAWSFVRASRSDNTGMRAIEY